MIFDLKSPVNYAKAYIVLMQLKNVNKESCYDEMKSNTCEICLTGSVCKVEENVEMRNRSNIKTEKPLIQQSINVEGVRLSKKQNNTHTHTHTEQVERENIVADES
ncbi:conserved hypothetical protein [Trichinella spiralis]|uniref:hypothetical protein n=1 Tax=Trichinella spiralis TaxID=6334 RepID=UPI0001EFEC83|nr:conserved hypothetical protein [Trichinella spiralis]